MTLFSTSISLIFAVAATCLYTDAAVVSVPIKNVTIQHGSSATFMVQISNATSNDTYQWIFNYVTVGNISIASNSSTAAFNPAYVVKANGTLPDIGLMLTITNVTSGGTVMVTGMTISESALLTVLISCPSPPFGKGCRNLSCTTNSSNFVGQPAGRNSSNTYTCYNSSTCGNSGQWSAPTTACGTDPVGCSTPGRWGSACNMTCGAGCPVPGKCNFSNGSCLTMAGTSTNNCMTNYYGDKCDQKRCPSWKWGDNCNETCGAGCLTPCDAVTGNCLANDTNGKPVIDCKTGYKGKKCDQKGCLMNITWGENCTRACGYGCLNGTCEFKTGVCTDPSGQRTNTCHDGYTGARCDLPTCNQNCNGVGECLAPNFCGNCPTHYESGPACRNVRLDGFVKGSLPTFAILTAVVILLTVLSKWYTKRKLKDA